MKILLVKPGEPAVECDIPNTLQAMQNTVGGYIEAVHPFPEKDLILVCNEEGRLRADCKPNRIIHNKNGSEIVYGTFFLCMVEGADFTDLTRGDLAKKYKAVFDLQLEANMI